jgi:hypothetical protein
VGRAGRGRAEVGPMLPSDRPRPLKSVHGFAIIRFGKYRRSWDSCVGTNGGGFPNRRTKLPGNLALILQDLSLAAFTFSEL